MARAAGGGDHQQARMDVTDEHGKALKELASRVEQFVGGKGNLQGAQFAE